MYEFLTFRKMITPVVIQVLFWIGVALVVIAGIVMIVIGIYQGALVPMFGGLLYILLGPIFVRVYCEVIMVFFRMLDALTDIKRNTDGLAGPTTGERAIPPTSLEPPAGA